MVGGSIPKPRLGAILEVNPALGPPLFDIVNRNLRRFTIGGGQPSWLPPQVNRLSGDNT